MGCGMNCRFLPYLRTSHAAVGMMSTMPSTFTAAVVQASPLVFDRERTLQKVHALTGEAAGQGARLVLFPEAFVSAYPRGLHFGAVVGSRTDAGRDDFRRYWESSA